jgi:hypothetical protein
VASAENPQRLHTVTVDQANGLIWETGSKYERASLVVTSPDGTTFERDFMPGDPLWFDLLNADGLALQDGEYQYELRLIQVLGTGDLKAQGRTVQAGQTTEELVERTIGFFAMKDGLMAGGDANNQGQGVQGPLSLNSDSDLEIDSPSQTGSQGTQRDQCFNDDVIVDGSLCTGFDCVCNENFGFDTIRLKENNLRVHFDDTSSTASFPRNDWRIRINDSANGGASYFAIEDSTGGRTPFLIEAGAPSDSIRIDSSGRIGIKNNNPVVELHVSDGDTPTLRLEQNGSSGFTPQTWDVAGNEAGFFVRDVTNGSKLSLRIQPNSPTESLFIRTTGVAIRNGSAAPSPLTVSGVGTNQEQLRLVDDTNSNAIATFGITDVSDLYIQTHTVGTGSNSDIILQGGLPDGAAPGGNVGIGTATPSEKLHVAGNICATGTIAACSDERFKKNVRTLTGALGKLAKLRGVEFDWKRNEFPDHKFTEEHQVGFIAQDVERVLPGVVHQGSDGYYSLDYGRLTPVLVEAVKELSATIDKKDAELAREREEIAKLHQENASFRLRLDRLEALIAVQGLQTPSQVRGGPPAQTP